MKKLLLTIVLWTWCFPQTFIGFFVYLYVCVFDKNKIRKWCDTGSLLTRTLVINGGISLGYFVFTNNLQLYATSRKIQMPLSDIQEKQNNLDKHECGHTLQGFLLGPLYLIIIGLPSIVWAGLFENYRKKNNISYYSFYTEKWANKWSGSNLS